MKRRTFLRSAAASVIATGWLRPGCIAALEPEDWIDLTSLAVVLPSRPSARETLAARVFTEESAKRCGLDWAGSAGASNLTASLLLGTHSTWSTLPGLPAVARDVASAARTLKADGFVLRTGVVAGKRWIAVCGADERGLLFGVGALLRVILFSRQSAKIDARQLTIASSPHCAIRGHQLGYRPKTNSYRWLDGRHVGPVHPRPCDLRHQHH